MCVQAVENFCQTDPAHAQMSPFTLAASYSALLDTTFTSYNSFLSSLLLRFPPSEWTNMMETWFPLGLLCVLFQLRGVLLQVYFILCVEKRVIKLVLHSSCALLACFDMTVWLENECVRLLLQQKTYSFFFWATIHFIFVNNPLTLTVQGWLTDNEGNLGSDEGKHHWGQLKCKCMFIE